MTTRTEPPSPRRLQQARARGDYPRSPLLKRGLVWAAVLFTIPAAASSLWKYGEIHIRRALQATDVSTHELGQVAARELHHLVGLSVPVLSVVLATHVVVHFAESRGSVLTQGARPRLFAHLTEIGSFRAIASFGTQWLSFALWLVYAWFWLRVHTPSWAVALGLPSRARELSSISALHLAWAACLLWCLCGSVDLLLAHRDWLQRMRMTRTESQHERQEHTGNPWLIQQRRERHLDVSTTLTLNAVEQATLVAHNRYQLAVLLRYVPARDKAPYVIGVAAGALAAQCVNAGVARGLPIVEDESLVRALARCKPEAAIPESLYESVAEVLAALPNITGTPSLDTELAPGL